MRWRFPLTARHHFFQLLLKSCVSFPKLCMKCVYVLINLQLVFSRFIQQLMVFGEAFKPFDSISQGLCLQGQSMSSSVQIQAQQVLYRRCYGRYFEVDRPFSSGVIGPEEENVLLNSEVGLMPADAPPQIQISLHFYNNMGCFTSNQKESEAIQEKKPAQSQVENVDVVKLKLKKARDTIQQFLGRKEKDLSQLEQQIAEATPEYQQTKNKRKIVPLLQAKKNLNQIIDSGETRLKLVRNKLDEVEMQQINAETINVLDDANQYTKQIQEELQAKDWQNVLAQAQQKCQIDWPQQDDIEEDPEFQKMWKELGGDKVDQRKVVEKKAVNVETTKHTQKEKQREIAVA